MRIPHAKDFEQRRKEFKQEWERAWRSLYKELDSQRDAIESHGITLEVHEGEVGVHLRFSDITVAALILSGSGENVILFNEEVSGPVNKLNQKHFRDVDEAVATFRDRLPQLIETLNRKKSIYRALGIG